MFSIQQTGSIADYAQEFEELCSIVTGVDERNLEHVFFNGLKPEMKELIKMKEPVGITQHIAAVIGIEGSAFCKSVGEAATGDYHYRRPVSTHRVCGASSSSNSQHRTGSGVDRGAQNSGYQRPQQKYVDAELDEMRREQICFK